MDGVEYDIRLEWAQQTIEGNEALIANLKEHISMLVNETSELRTLVDTLKKVQESLLTDKLAAESSLEFLLREKAELSGENASLRAHAKDLSRSLEAYASVNSLLAAVPPLPPGAASTGSPMSTSAGSGSRSTDPSCPEIEVAGGGEGAGSGAAQQVSSLASLLATSRYLNVRMLEFSRNAGHLLSNRGEELWEYICHGTGSLSGAREALRAGLVAALAEAVGVEGDLRALLPPGAASLPAPEPLPPLLLAQHARIIARRSGEGSPTEGLEEGFADGQLPSPSVFHSPREYEEEGGGEGGFFTAFFRLLVGDVESEAAVMAEEELAVQAAERVAEEKRRRADKVRKAIERGVELDDEQKRAALLAP